MSDKPDYIIDVQPTNISTFSAFKWIGDPDDEALLWMAERFGWVLGGLTDTRRGRALVIKSRSKKRYTIQNGEWIIALGASGSLRVVSDRQYNEDYREVSA